AVPGDGLVRVSLHSRHRPAEVRGEEHLQAGAVPALRQRCGAGRVDTSFGNKVARHWNSDPQWMEYRRAAVDRHCRHNYELSSPFLVERRGERGAERVPSGPALGMTLEPLKTSLGITRDTSALLPPCVHLTVPSRSQPSHSCLLCSMMHFYPAKTQMRWFQGQQELSGHIVATDLVPNGDWTHQLLVVLETTPR
ncbi:H-2 class II histocompatibility antigen, partial [Lamprotornis superbus]